MNKAKTGNIFFYAAFTIELLIMLIDKSAIANPIEGRLFQLTFVLFALKVCMTKYTVGEWAVIVLFEVLGLISYLTTGRNEIIRIVTMIAACKNMDIKAVFSYMFKVVLAGCSGLVILSLTGILGTVKLTAVFRGDAVETRYCLGMGHPNSLHCMFFMLILLFLYLYGSSVKRYWLAVLFAANIGMFFLTGSKTGTMVTAFAIVFAAVLVSMPKLQKTPLFYALTAFLLLICTGIAWIAAAFSEKVPYYPAMRRFDRLLSDRIVNLYYDSASHAGTLPTWTLFGVPENEYYFDMGWVRLFYWYGIIPACIYVAVLVLLIWQLYREKQYLGIMVLASLFIYTLVEAHIISVYLTRDYTLLFIGARFGAMFYVNKGKNGHFWELPGMLQRKAG